MIIVKIYAGFNSFAYWDVAIAAADGERSHYKERRFSAGSN